MNIIVNLQAEQYFYEKLKEKELGIHNDQYSTGFFFSKEENIFVVFDNNFEVKLVPTISNCFKFLKKE